MSKIKAIPLGTSSGQPTMSREVTALGLWMDDQSDDWRLIDCGEGAAARIKRAGWKWGHLKEIWVTHAHADHCAGLPGVIAQLGLHAKGAPSSIKVCAPESVRIWLELSLKTFETEGAPSIEWMEPQDGRQWRISDDLMVEAVEMSHRIRSHGYAFVMSKERSRVELQELQALGIEPGPWLGALKAEGKLPEGMDPRAKKALKRERALARAFIGGDNQEPERLIERARGFELWAHEATYLHADAMKDGAGLRWGHCSAEQLGKAAEQGQPGALLMTHFSSRYADTPEQGSPSVEDLRQEAQRFFKGRLVVAKEGVPVEVSARIEPIEELTAGLERKPGR